MSPPPARGGGRAGWLRVSSTAPRCSPTWAASATRRLPAGSRTGACRGRCYNGEEMTDIDPTATRQATTRSPTQGRIYVIQSSGHAAVKIGFTSREDVATRLAALQTGNPHLLRVLASAPATTADERIVHGVFATERMAGEWFDLSPRLQVFIDLLGHRGLSSALAEATQHGEPEPRDWQNLLVRETHTGVVFSLRIRETIAEARKVGNGPQVFRSTPAKFPGSFTRLYVVTEVSRWLRAQKIPHRLDRDALSRLTIRERVADGC